MEELNKKNMRVYTREKVLQMCKEQLVKDVSKFYSIGFVNCKGITSDTHEYYSEVIAEFVLSEIKHFESIKSVSRGERSYKMGSHTGGYVKTTNRIEEYIAKDMFTESITKEYDYIGRVIDYQTPLNNKRKDGYGKIDVLSHKDDSLYIIELKRPNSRNPETMLRCVLEAYTYSKVVDKEKLIKDFGLSRIVDESKVMAAPLVAMNDSQWKELNEGNGRPCLKKLMERLGITPFYYREISPKHYEILK